MAASVQESDLKKKNNIFQWIINPFHYVAGIKALIVGIIIILISGFLAYLQNYRFNDLISFHLQNEYFAVWQGVTDGIISWLITGILLLTAGKLISKSKFRIVDVFGTQALARFPYLLLALIISIPGLMLSSLRFTTNLMNSRDIKQLISVDLLAFIFFISFSLAMLIWMIALMYRAFAVSCNVSGKKAIIAFIICLVIALILSSIIIKRIPAPTAGITITAAEAVNTETKARDYVKLFAENKFSEATEQFDDTMKSVISEQRIREIWTSLISQYGQFRNQGSIRHTRAGKYDVYDVQCNFEKGWVNCRVSFDDNGKVAGLYFQ